MRTTNKLICLAILIAIMTCSAVANSETDHRNEQHAKITEKVDVLQIGIENYYRLRTAQLKSQTESKIKSLEVSDKAEELSVSAQVKIADQVLELNNYERIIKQLRVRANNYNPQRERYEILQMDDASELYAKYQTAITKIKNDIRTQYETKLAKLQANKMYELKIALPRLEKKLKQNVMEPSAKTDNGVVSGIVCSDDMSTAIVNGKIVRVGSSLGNVKIARISLDHVEFERKGKSWTQKVGEAASSNW